MIRPLIPRLIAFTIWAVAFGVLYGAQALGCVWHLPEALHRASLIFMWVATLATLSAILWVQWKRIGRSTEQAEHRADFFITLAATGAAVVTFFPVTFATLCQ
jgi:hypothetical protein